MGVNNSYEADKRKESTIDKIYERIWTDWFYLFYQGQV